MKSARQAILDLIAKILPREHVARYTNLFGRKLDAYRDEVRAETRRDVARFVREAKVPHPIGEVEEHVNDCLDSLADDIERGRT